MRRREHAVPNNVKKIHGRGTCLLATRKLRLGAPRMQADLTATEMMADSLTRRGGSDHFFGRYFFTVHTACIICIASRNPHAHQQHTFSDWDSAITGSDIMQVRCWRKLPRSDSSPAQCLPVCVSTGCGCGWIGWIMGYNVEWI